MKFILAFLVFFIPCQSVLRAVQSPLFGDWQEPEGSIVRIEPCSAGICLRIVKLGPSAPSSTDAHNPQALLRNRPLCGLNIGQGFSITDATHATGGSLYDPKSGNTYHGTLAVKDGQLSLRGYIGLSIFGRTEVWQRPSTRVQPCFAR